MSRSVEQLQEQLELYINEQAADLHVFRVTLQVMFQTLLQQNPNRSTMIGGLKDQVLAALNRMVVDGADIQAAQRRKELEISRAEEFFQEVQIALGVPDKSSGGKH